MYKERIYVYYVLTHTTALKILYRKSRKEWDTEKKQIPFEEI